MNNSQRSLLYTLCGIFSVMVNWYFNHSVIYAILAWAFWPAYMFYALLTGHFAHGGFNTIWNYYFN